jgi:hypothetical protein
LCRRHGKCNSQLHNHNPTTLCVFYYHTICCIELGGNDDYCSEAAGWPPRKNVRANQVKR